MEADIEDIMKYLSGFEPDKNRADEDVKRLKKYRVCLLEDIHTQQQCLDSIDYLIREIETEKRI